VPNRYCRDELILNMLLLVQNANLEQDEAPGGVVQPQAMSIQWLQDILDFCYHKSPFSSTITHVDFPCSGFSDTLILPADFILDVRDGYLVRNVASDGQSLQRVYRRAFQDFLDQRLGMQRQRIRPGDYTIPQYYSVVERDPQGHQLMQITPVPQGLVNGVLWYYQLPPRLGPSDKPVFPSDQVIIEYMRIRALEWMGLADVGTSLKYEEKLVAGMKAAGLLNEPERTQFPFDTMNYRQGNFRGSPFAWIGPV
jgi:hypothetical protein